MVIVDDHPAIREVICHSAEQAIDMVVAANTGSLEEAFRFIEAHDPDVAVVDLSLSDELSFEFFNTVRAHHPDTKLLAFSTHDETVHAGRVLREGASGYLMKESSRTELLTAVRRVAAGKMYLSPEMTVRILRRVQKGRVGEMRFPIDELTDRELHVFQMVGRGLGIETIADRLGLTRQTVETYRRRAKEKLGYDAIGEVGSHAARWIRRTNGEKDRALK